MTEAQSPANGRKIKTLESAESIGKRSIEPQLRMEREHGDENTEYQQMTECGNVGNLQCTVFTQSPAMVTIPGDHRRATKEAANPERANPTTQETDADRRVADLISVFAFEVPLNAASSVAYGFLPRLPRPGSPGPELRPSPSCDDIGVQWR